MDADTIRRLITNQRAEHVPHAFRAGSAGMADFNALVPALRSLPSPKLARWLDLIDAIRATHRGCVPCTGKILAYSAIIADRGLPKRAARYRRLYHDLIQQAPVDRDYFAEVRASLRSEPEPPAAEAHRNFWRTVALSLPSQPGRGCP
jgi:hypothetical protein